MKITKLFCPITGLEVVSRPELNYTGLEGKFSTSFYTVGKNIIYCFPKGRADLEGVTNSLSRNLKIAESLKNETGKFIQIEDYANLKSSTPAARKYFLDTLNSNNRLVSVIFCNLSTPFAIAVKLGSRFKSRDITIHIARDYGKAVKLALNLCLINKLPSDSSAFPFNLKVSDGEQSLKPMEIMYDKTLDIIHPGFSNKSVVLDRSIFYSKTTGCLNSQYVPEIENMLQAYQEYLPLEHSIEYIVVDSKEIKGSSRKARFQYMKSLQTWHRKHPIRLYVFSCANIFVKTSAILARPFISFNLKVARDIKQAFEFIKNDRHLSPRETFIDRFHSRRRNPESEEMDKLFAFIGSIDWEKEGAEPAFPIEENSPYFYLFQSVKLIKEELDQLFRERKEAENELISSLHKNQNLYLELQHRVKNSFMLLSGMINLMVDSKSSEIEKNILREINTKILAVSNMYSLLYTSDSINSAFLDEYIGSLIDSFDIAAVKVIFQTELEHIVVPVEKVVPIGLIVSELITNSIKHAFKERAQGIISVVCRSTENGITLTYSDNGPGFSIAENECNSGSMGIPLIVSLVEQIHGELKFENVDGMRFTVLF